MATLTLTQENFKKTIKAGDIVLVDFWADWCGPCKAFAPVFEAASEKHSDIIFAKVDTERETELAEAFDIRSIPTLAIYRQQILLFAQPGALPAPALEALINKTRQLDMDEIRRKMKAAQ